MGGLLHLFDFHHSGTSRKLDTHKSNEEEGLEAPRNSLEFSLETLQSYDAIGESIPYAIQVRQNAPTHNYSPGGAPMKELIDNETSKETDSRRNAPSVVARLMGMDMIPTEPTAAVYLKEKRNETTGISRKEQNGSTHCSPNGLKPSRQTEYEVLSHSKERSSSPYGNGIKSGKPKPREHPQEEQLQKFKKEFEAWQSARIWEHSKIVDLGSAPRQWLAQECLNKEKMALYADSRRIAADEKPTEHKGHNLQPVLKSSSQNGNGIRRHDRRGVLQNTRKEQETSSSRSSDVEKATLTTLDEKQEKSDAPTTIVILKPGPDRSTSSEDSWTGSSEIVEEDGSIQDFLEEVKERLKLEMQGLGSKKENVVRGGGMETPFSEKSSNPKQIARHIAKQVRESVTRDLGMNLLRSESTRSYACEQQVIEPDSPEFIHRGTRKFLSDRLRNVLKAETHKDNQNGGSRASMLGREDKRRRHVEDAMKTMSRDSHWENVKDEREMQSRSFRQGMTSDDRLQMGERSPRNLVRSLSAPVSGNSFGKLLLEDRNILTGAQIRRRHEETENMPFEVTKSRKERFNFRGKVSHLRYKFNFRNKLFGRKFQSVEEMGGYESDTLKELLSGRVSMMSFENSLENSTEVPPSPASICSSPHEEFWRNVDHPSPISTLDAPSVEDVTVSQVFRDISSDLHELRRQINKLGSDSSDNTEVVEEKALETETVELEGHAEVYVRDILMVSGLYDGSSDCSISRWDPHSKPIGNWVFEKVDESYEKRAEESGTTEAYNESKVDHKVLFDLVNEALSTILGPSVPMSKFRKKILESEKVPPPRGNILLDAVWRMICMYINPAPVDGSYYSLDAMVTRDLATIPWWGMKHDESTDIDQLGRELEGWILSELIGEAVKDTVRIHICR